MTRQRGRCTNTARCPACRPRLSRLGALPIKNYTTNVVPEGVDMSQWTAQGLREGFDHRGHQCNSCGMHHCHDAGVAVGDRTRALSSTSRNTRAGPGPAGLSGAPIRWRRRGLNTQVGPCMRGRERVRLASWAGWSNARRRATSPRSNSADLPLPGAMPRRRTRCCK